MVGAVALIKRGTQAEGNERQRWRNGQVVGVYDEATFMNQAVQVEQGKFYWLVYTDRTVEDILYLADRYPFVLTAQSMNDGAMIEFTQTNPAATPEWNLDTEIVEKWVQAIASSLDTFTVVSVNTVTNTQFTVDCLYNGDDDEDTVSEAMIAIASGDLVQQRRWIVDASGMLRLSVENGRVDATFDELDPFLVDQAGGA